MSTGQWLLLVGMRVFDVGLLVAWLVWFFRTRDEDEDLPGDDEGGGGGGEPAPEPRPPPSGPARMIPQGRWRSRSHRGARERRTRERNVGGRPPAPARVRNPRTPVPAERRS